MDEYQAIPPWWVLLAAAVPAASVAAVVYRWVARDELGRRPAAAARALAGVASLVFTLAVVAAGWGCWLLASLPPREVVFAVIWAAAVLYMLVAAGTFKTQVGRFGARPASVARYLLEALLWGPIMVLMLLPRRPELDERPPER